MWEEFENAVIFKIYSFKIMRDSEAHMYIFYIYIYIVSSYVVWISLNH